MFHSVVFLLCARIHQGTIGRFQEEFSARPVPIVKYQRTRVEHGYHHRGSLRNAARSRPSFRQRRQLRHLPSALSSSLPASQGIESRRRNFGSVMADVLFHFSYELFMRHVDTSASGGLCEKTEQDCIEMATSSHGFFFCGSGNSGCRCRPVLWFVGLLYGKSTGYNHLQFECSRRNWTSFRRTARWNRFGGGNKSRSCRHPCPSSRQQIRWNHYLIEAPSGRVREDDVTMWSVACILHSDVRIHSQKGCPRAANNNITSRKDIDGSKHETTT